MTTWRITDLNKFIKNKSSMSKISMLKQKYWKLLTKEHAIRYSLGYYDVEGNQSIFQLCF